MFIPKNHRALRPVSIFEMMKNLKQKGYLNQEKRLKKEIEAVELKYGSEEKGSWLCKCSILLGFFMSKKLERLRSELLSEDKITRVKNPSPQIRILIVFCFLLTWYKHFWPFGSVSPGLVPQSSLSQAFIWSTICVWILPQLPVKVLEWSCFETKLPFYQFNRSFRRKRGMASNPLHNTRFFCIFQTNFAMAMVGKLLIQKRR